MATAKKTAAKKSNRKKMEVCEIMIALAGDSRQIVRKTVTAPEIAVLQAMHGEGSIRDIKVLHEVDCVPRNERARLARRYNAALVMNRLYPGAQPVLILKASDLSPDSYLDADDGDNEDEAEDEAEAKSDGDPFENAEKS